jgi:heme oxygenase
VEARLFPAALSGRAPYAGMLTAMLGLHEPLERQLAALPALAALRLDLPGRRKAHRLRADLADLAAAGTPEPREVPEVALHLEDVPSSLGALYVLEGSTLGGRVLREQARHRLGDVPTAFLDGYGQQTGRRWKQVRIALDAAVAASPDPAAAEQRVRHGAVATFTAFDHLLARAGWAHP